MSRFFRRALSLLLVLLLLPSPSLALGEDAEAGLRIAEVMVKNKATLRDADGDFSDWLELENAAARPFPLAGWALSDSEGKPGWALPARTLQPGERLLVFASGKDRREGECHTDFALSAGETLYLRAPGGDVADAVPCAGAEKDVSLLRTEVGFVPCLFPTPGYVDTAAGYEAWQTGLGTPGPLCISEVMVYETRARFGEYYRECDWVELQNSSDEELSLAGWTLADSSGSCALPARTLQPGETLLLRCSETPALSEQLSDFGTGFALGSDDEQLFLYGPDGALVDWAALRGIPFGVSFGRDPFRGGWCYFEAPSPGKANASGLRRIAASPVLDGRDGVFEGVESVEAALSAAGEIRYTLDGSLPDSESDVYTEPLRFEKTAVLRAVAFEPDALPSRPLNLSFFLNEGHTVPIMSLLTDSPGRYRNFYQYGDITHLITANAAWYDGEEGFSLPCDLKINGETSRVLPKKNLRLRFRAVYGAEELEYDCFGGGVTHFASLLLRSGQNYAGAVMKNELVCALADAATDAVLVQRFRYCVLYVNGKYAGIYALMEKTDEHMAAAHFGVSRDSVTVVEASAPANSEFYREVVEPILTTDMREAENYAAVCEKLDIDSLIDWTIIEGWCGNKDLQSGNLRYVRSTENDGKWRVMLYDLDAVFSESGACFDLLNDTSLQTRQIGQMLAQLFRNASFRDRFLTRAGELLAGPLSDEALLAEIDRLEAILRPEIGRNHAAFGLDPAQWPKNVDRLRAFCAGDGWANTCRAFLTRFFDLSAAEQALYWGALG